MIMTSKLLVALAICAGIAALTLWAQETYWLGDDNVLLLNVLLIAHVIISSLILWLIPGGCAIQNCSDNFFDYWSMVGDRICLNAGNLVSARICSVATDSIYFPWMGMMVSGVNGGVKSTR